MDILYRDIRYAFRQVRRAPGFVFVVVTTLALGIGANAALFTLINAAVLQPPAGVGNSRDLVWLSNVDAETSRATRLSRTDFDAYRAGTTAFTGAALMLDQTFTLTGDQSVEEVRGQAVSRGYFTVLETPFALGSGFSALERAAGDDPDLVVIGHDLWQRRYGADPGIVGRTIHVNRRPMRVAGVARDGFVGADRESRRQLWVPLSALPALFPNWTDVRDARQPFFRAIARLAPGVIRKLADTQVAAVASRLALSEPELHAHLTARVFDASAGVPPNGMTQVLPIAGIAVAVTGLLLLIACANAGGVFLARGIDRRREIAVRLAIGAGRGRLVRQLLTESLLLAGVAGTLGLLVALWSLDLVTSLMPDLPLAPSLDLRVVAFTALVAILAGVMTGLAPALVATRTSLSATMKATTAGAEHRSALQSAFLVCQIALSLCLLVVAGLFLRSLDKASRLDLGFDASRRVLAATFDLGLRKDPPAVTSAWLDGLIAQVAALPGVTAVSATTAMPTAEWITTRVEASAGGGAPRSMLVTEFRVRPAFFSAIGLRLVRGRDFDRAGGASAAGTVIVNESLARAMWAGEDPIGQHLAIDGSATAFSTVVAVAQDSIVADITSRNRPAIYLPQAPSATLARVTLLVRAGGDAGTLAHAVRHAIASADDQVPITGLRTLDHVRDAAIAERRAGAALLTLAGTLGLGLAAVGVAGAMALSVSQRTREIGVRLALGAAPSQVVRYFVGRGMRAAAVGMTIGTLAALAASRVLSSMLFGIAASDAVAYVAVIAVLGFVAAVACWLPARRAACVDPLEALRRD